MIQWHSGEPLVLPLQTFKDYNQEVKKYLEKIRINQSIQTNGILLNDEWCSFFKAENFQVGVSLDGPKFFNDKYRINRRGR